MNFRTTFLLMTSATALVACRGDLRIGGEGDGGVNLSETGVVPDAAPSESAQGDDGSITVVAADSGTSLVVDSGTSPLIVFDGGVGGICEGPDAGSATDAGDAMAPACGCTRRPGPGTSAFSCPPGIGENKTLALGPSGGTVTLEGRQGTASGVPASIDFAPGSVQTTTEVTLIETGIAPPLDLLDWSPVYLVQPAGLVLGYPARIALPDSNGSNVSGVIQSETPADLAIWFSPDGTCFKRLLDYALNAGFETGTIPQLGYLIVASAREPSTASCP